VASLEIEWLGEVAYGEALALQEQAVEDRRAGLRGDRLLLLEHPPVVTLGRSARAENLLVSPQDLARRDVALFEASRGGDVTYHARGQLVGYLVVDLAARGQRDAHRFLRCVEGALIDALGGCGIAGYRVPGCTGVFAGTRRKIASVGIGLRHWVTWHGFALNVSLDLRGFDAIVPCGLRGVVMTSVVDLIGPQPEIDERMRWRVAESFQNAFGFSGSGAGHPGAVSPV
jgi:lipoate-protein ligase B